MATNTNDSILELRQEMTAATTAFHLAFMSEEAAERMLNAVAVRIADAVANGETPTAYDVAAYRCRRHEHAEALLKCNEADERLAESGNRLRAAVEKAKAVSTLLDKSKLDTIGEPPYLVGGVAIPKGGAS